MWVEKGLGAEERGAFSKDQSLLLVRPTCVSDRLRAVASSTRSGVDR